MSRANKKHRRKNIGFGICFSTRRCGASSSPLRNAVFTFSGVFWQRFWQAPIIRMEIFRHTGSIKVYCTLLSPGSDGVVFHKSHTIKNAFRSIFENCALTCHRLSRRADAAGGTRNCPRRHQFAQQFTHDASSYEHLRARKSRHYVRELLSHTRTLLFTWIHDGAENRRTLAGTVENLRRRHR